MSLILVAYILAIVTEISSVVGGIVLVGACWDRLIDRPLLSRAIVYPVGILLGLTLALTGMVAFMLTMVGALLEVAP